MVEQQRQDWGYIEGYFGRLLDWPQRIVLLDQMAQSGLGTWVYAPKEDPLHRRQWREDYDAAWCEGFAAFCSAADERSVCVVAAVSPGLDIRYDDGEDVRLLEKKFAQMRQLGAGALGLFFDDLKTPAAQADAALAVQQVALADRLLRQVDAPEDLWFCPTQYCDFLAGGDIAASSYLPVVAQLPAGVRLLWTGRHVISLRLDRDTLAGITALLGRTPTLWDNLYANDYAPRRLVLSPYTGRDDKAPLLLNPTGLPHTDALYLDLLGRHAKGIAPEQAFADALVDCGVPDAMLPLATALFALADEADDGAEDPHTLHIGRSGRQQLKQWAEALYELTFGDWSSPLQREWYPYLAGTLQDIKLLMAQDAGALPDGLLRTLPPGLRSMLADG